MVGIDSTERCLKLEEDKLREQLELDMQMTREALGGGSSSSGSSGAEDMRVLAAGNVTFNYDTSQKNTETKQPPTNGGEKNGGGETSPVVIEDTETKTTGIPAWLPIAMLLAGNVMGGTGMYALNQYFGGRDTDNVNVVKPGFGTVTDR
jgi:hypothetical protein